MKAVKRLGYTADELVFLIDREFREREMRLMGKHSLDNVEEEIIQMRYKFAESQRKEKLKRESARSNCRDGDKAVVSFSVRDIFNEKEKKKQKDIRVDPEMVLLEKSKMEIQNQQVNQNSEIENYLKYVAERIDDKVRRQEMEEEYRQQIQQERMSKQQSSLKKYDYLNKQEFYKQQNRQLKHDLQSRHEKSKRQQQEQQNEEEYLSIIKAKERKKQLLEANVRQKHKDFKDKIKLILKEQEQKIEQKRIQLEQLQAEKAQLVIDKQNTLTQEIDQKKEINKEKLLQAKQIRHDEIMKLTQLYLDKIKEIDQRGVELDKEREDFKGKRLEYVKYKNAIRDSILAHVKQQEQDQKDKIMKIIEEQEVKLRDQHSIRLQEMQKRKEFESQRNYYRQTIQQKNQELEKSKKQELKLRIDNQDSKVDDFRMKFKSDQRLRIEYEKLKRKEKEDSVKRKEKIAEYEREKRVKEIEEEKELRERMRKEKEEIENYKRQMRENAKFKKELIKRSFETLQMKSKSPIFSSSKMQGGSSENLNSHRSNTGSVRLPDVLQSPKQFSQHIKSLFIDDANFRIQKSNSPSTLSKSINTAIGTNQIGPMPGTASSGSLLRSIGSTIQLRLPKSIQKIASLEAKYFSQFPQNQSKGLVDSYLQQQGESGSQGSLHQHYYQKSNHNINSNLNNNHHRHKLQLSTGNQSQLTRNNYQNQQKSRGVNRYQESLGRQEQQLLQSLI
ncbi:UNKNOWN [Stylonychia lemnae]|uniref:Uncharacterized protein n=1 Tax=Stylonychia lemnae TaxID=5949 RepID=A0A078AKL4_STYLE|nr:UNKNOWN [Stylonychia lemnae]|eukprot:CDW82754.1 UNKNOWN [Stylonychia lemnae]